MSAKKEHAYANVVFPLLTKNLNLVFDKEISFDLIGVVFFLRPIRMSHVIPERVITGTVSVDAIQTNHDHYTMRLLIN